MNGIVQDLIHRIAEGGANCVKRRKVTPAFDMHWRHFRSAQLDQKSAPVEK